MIVSAVDEVEWRRVLCDLPVWTPSPSHVVVLAPHPDDETLGLGGLIATLSALRIRVTVVAVTDGENAYANVSGLGLVRRKEQLAALECLGVGEG